MARSADTPDAEVKLSFGWPIQFALRPAPHRFNASTFATRIVQHLLVYGAILIAAVYACLFISFPWQTALLSVFLVLFVMLFVSLFSAPHNRLRTILEGGLLASYVAGMAVVVKASEFLANVLAMLLHSR